MSSLSQSPLILGLSGYLLEGGICQIIFSYNKIIFCPMAYTADSSHSLWHLDGSQQVQIRGAILIF